MEGRKTSCGHEEHYAKGMCRSCYEKNLRKVNKEYHERQKENCRKWARENPEKKKKSDRESARRRSFVVKRASYLRRRYGITIEEYDKMLEKQNGCCAICGIHCDDIKSKHLCIDHCHQTGKVRGLLCRSCNAYLGLWKEDINFFKRAILYLQDSDGYGFLNIFVNKNRKKSNKNVLSNIYKYKKDKERE